MRALLDTSRIPDHLRIDPPHNDNLPPVDPPEDDGGGGGGDGSGVSRNRTAILLVGVLIICMIGIAFDGMLAAILPPPEPSISLSQWLVTGFALALTFICILCFEICLAVVSRLRLK